MRVELALSSLPPGSRRLLEAGTVEVAVFNVAGRIFALDNACPHRGGPLIRGTIESSPEGPMLRCPMHGWPFLLESGASPRPARATVYPVEVSADAVVVEVPEAAAERPR